MFKYFCMYLPPGAQIWCLCYCIFCCKNFLMKEIFCSWTLQCLYFNKLQQCLPDNTSCRRQELEQERQRLADAGDGSHCVSRRQILKSGSSGGRSIIVAAAAASAVTAHAIAEVEEDLESSLQLLQNQVIYVLNNGYFHLNYFALFPGYFTSRPSRYGKIKATSKAGHR